MQLTSVRLLVTNYAECFRFYRDVMGLTIRWGNEDGPYAEFGAGPAAIALYARALMAEAIGNTEIPLDSPGLDRAAVILAVTSVDETFAELTRRGIEVASPPQDRPLWGIRTAHFRDPAGNLIEVYTGLPEAG